MKIRMVVSRTFQAQQFEPVKIDLEVTDEITDEKEFVFTHNKLHNHLEEALVASETRLRNLYCPEETVEVSAKRTGRRQYGR